MACLWLDVLLDDPRVVIRGHLDTLATNALGSTCRREFGLLRVAALAWKARYYLPVKALREGQWGLVDWWFPRKVVDPRQCFINEWRRHFMTEEPLRDFSVACFTAKRSDILHRVMNQLELEMINGQSISMLMHTEETIVSAARHEEWAIVARMLQRTREHNYNGVHGSEVIQRHLARGIDEHNLHTLLIMLDASGNLCDPSDTLWLTVHPLISDKDTTLPGVFLMYGVLDTLEWYLTKSAAACFPDTRGYYRFMTNWALVWVLDNYADDEAVRRAVTLIRHYIGRPLTEEEFSLALRDWPGRPARRELLSLLR